MVPLLMFYLHISPDARRLAEKIRTARINKERAQQLSDKKVLQTQQAEYDAAMNK